MNVAEAIGAACAGGLERLDAQLLLLHALGRSTRDRAWLLAHDTDALPAEASSKYAALTQRRAGGEPLAYIVGRKEFHGLDLEVDRRVLVPRPDTETLVDWAVQLLEDGGGSRVLDLGTGSGAIALALKKCCPHCDVHALDASEDALQVARANAQRLGLAVRFTTGDWLSDAAGTYDLVVSNPPYVREGDPHLQHLAHEPMQALVAGTDGLRDIRTIAAQAPRHLARGGWLLLEHGHDQAPAVRTLLRQAGFGYVASRRDLAGIERCTGGRWLELG